MKKGYIVKCTGRETVFFGNRKYADQHLKAIAEEYRARGWSVGGSVSKGSYRFNEPGWKEKLHAGEPYRQQAAIIKKVEGKREMFVGV